MSTPHSADRQIDGNQFILAKLDPEKPEELRVRVWSDIFGRGGNVTLESENSHALISRKFEESLEVGDLKEELQEIADHFNDSLAEFWRELIRNARNDCASYYRRQIDECTQSLAELEKLG